MHEIKNDAAQISVYTDQFNKRIRIDDYKGELPNVLKLIKQEVQDWTEKLIVKAHSNDLPFYLSQGFTNEGFIKSYFSGSDMYFATMYFSSGREQSKKWHEEQSIVTQILKGDNDRKAQNFEEVKIASHDEADELANIYGELFQVYPTPLNKPAYVKKTMDEFTLYVYVREEDKIVSAASAEINRKHGNAELTDCASLEHVQGKGHMKKLLFKLEQELRKQGILCLYSLARAESYGMNKAFFQLGYTYGGRLINNCFIYSGLEDMNVWYKNSQL